MKDNPLFTVIMPNFNNSPYIKTAIESVLSQKYGNWELIIVDDSSTDDSLRVIEPFLENTGITLIKNTRNRGVAYAAQQAVQQSSGEIIGTLDSDDVLHEDALAVMVEEHKSSPECGLIYSNHYIWDDSSGATHEAPWFGVWPDYMSLQEALLKRDDTATISMHFRTFKKSAYEMTEGYRTQLPCFEDRDLYYKLEKVGSIKGIDKCLYYYRHNQDVGAFRNRPLTAYYWYVCEYEETKRRLGVHMPSVNGLRISPFFGNLMYYYLRKSPYIKKERLRVRMYDLFTSMGYYYLNKNKLLAYLYIINSYLYGYTPVTVDKIKKLFIPPSPTK